MKKRSLILPLTPLWVYLFEIPLGVLFGLCIFYHNRVDSVFKLFPLEIVIGALMIFLPVYFFRVLRLSVDELREIGPFSKRESVTITEKRTLTLQKCKRGKLRVELLGGADEAPALPFLRSVDGFSHADYCMLRSMPFGRISSIQKILTLFGIPEEEAKILSKGKHQFANDDLEVSSEQKDEGIFVSVRFLKTIL